MGAKIVGWFRSKFKRDRQIDLNFVKKGRKMRSRPLSALLFALLFSAVVGVATGGQLKVISYNVMHDGGGHAKKSQPELRTRALIQLLRSQNADVILLQEVRPALLAQLKANVADMGYHFSSDLLVGTQDREYQVPTLPAEQLTLSKTAFASVSLVARSPSMTYHPALVTSMNVAGTPFVVVNLHLEHEGGLTACGSTRRARTLELALKAVSRAPHVLVGGARRVQRRGLSS